MNLNTTIPMFLNKEKDKLIILDQTVLPNKEKFLELDTKESIFESIKKLRVRGAPAIGITAAFGIYVCMNKSKATEIKSFRKELQETKDYLANSRPTAVNLFWALDRMETRFEKEAEKPIVEIKKALLEESEKLFKEDQDMGLAIGKYGLELLKPNMGLLTHCNAGGLATSGIGTALAPIYLGHNQGYNFKVFSDETRPLLQGSRLTAYELYKAGIDITIICDDMASIVMKEGKIDAVLVGCDRVAANGDTANKIGTSGVAILAKEYNIPMYILGPTSTIDLKIKTGKEIKIEIRDSEEIVHGFGSRTAVKGIKAYNPAFDVTDAKYITAIITEKGIVKPPYKGKLEKLFE